MPRQRTRSERIEARLTPESLAVVRRAAELQGRSLSDFVVLAAENAAHQTIQEIGVIRLSAQEQRQFAEMLLNPAEPTLAMKRARDAHKQLFDLP